MGRKRSFRKMQNLSSMKRNTPEDRLSPSGRIDRSFLAAKKKRRPRTRLAQNAAGPERGWPRTRLAQNAAGPERGWELMATRETGESGNAPESQNPQF